MSIRFSLPPQIESVLGQNGQEPSAAAKEAALVELYRLRRITHFQMCEALGIGRLEGDGLLKRHEVPMELSLAEFRAELAELRQGLGS